MIDEKNQKENARKREIKKDGIWTYIMEINVTYSCRNLQQLTTVRSMSPFEQMDDAQQMSSAPGCLDGLGRVGPVGPLGLKTF